MAITKYLPSKPFSSGTEYEVFKYNYCNRCKKHKERENGFPAFPEDGGCPIEDAMEFARFDRERFPGDKIRKLIDSDGDVAKWHHCMEFETWQVNKMSELKRCPFCGGKAKIDKTIANTVSVECTVCHASSRMILCTEGDIEQKAIEAWNTRKPMQNIVEQLGIKHNESTINYHNLKDVSCLGERHAYRNAIEIVKEEGE